MGQSSVVRGLVAPERMPPPVSVGLIISSIALGISFVVSTIKLVDWLIHTDPRALMRTGRSLLFSLAVTSVPCLIILLVYQQWALAMMLGAGMLIAPTMLNWRVILPRPKFRPMWTECDPLDAMRGDFGQPPSPELVRRAATVLEGYLLHVSHPEISARIDGHQRSVTQETPPPSGQDGAIGAEEALEILGLEPGATAAAIHAAHRRLLQLVHPDRGGTNYLAAKINRAKETLLAEANRKPRASMRNGVRATPKRAAAKGE
jgi:hypothetical protein